MTEMPNKIAADVEAADALDTQAATIAALREALSEIEDRHMPSEPMSWGGTEYDWAVRQYGSLRGIARAAIAKESNNAHK